MIYMYIYIYVYVYNISSNNQPLIGKIIETTEVGTNGNFIGGRTAMLLHGLVVAQAFFHHVFSDNRKRTIVVVQI